MTSCALNCDEGVWTWIFRNQPHLPTINCFIVLCLVHSDSTMFHKQNTEQVSKSCNNVALARENPNHSTKWLLYRKWGHFCGFTEIAYVNDVIHPKWISMMIRSKYSLIVINPKNICGHFNSKMIRLA